jgi:hypothetical protein
MAISISRQVFSFYNYYYYYLAVTSEDDTIVSKLILCNNQCSEISSENIAAWTDIRTAISIMQYGKSRSRCPRGLRRGSAAVRLLGLSVRILPGGHGCLSVVSYVCCQVEVPASADHSSREVVPCVCVCVCVCLYDHESSIMRRSWPSGGCCAMVKKMERNV